MGIKDVANELVTWPRKRMGLTNVIIGLLCALFTVLTVLDLANIPRNFMLFVYRLAAFTTTLSEEQLRSVNNMLMVFGRIDSIGAWVMMTLFEFTTYWNLAMKIAIVVAISVIVWFIVNKCSDEADQEHHVRRS